MEWACSVWVSFVTVSKGSTSVTVINATSNKKLQGQYGCCNDMGSKGVEGPGAVGRFVAFVLVCVVALCLEEVSGVDVVQGWMWHGAGLCCQAGSAFWSVPLVPAIALFPSLLCLFSSLCNYLTKAIGWMVALGEG
jgi:hypothetical protein